MEFHGNTGANNSIVILSSKLSVLNFFAASTSLLSMLLFIFCSRGALAFDNFVNVIIVWFGFKFTTPWFKRFQCGHSMKFWFAVSKTMAWSGSYKFMCRAGCRKSQHPDGTDRVHSVSINSVLSTRQKSEISNVQHVRKVTDSNTTYGVSAQSGSSKTDIVPPNQPSIKINSSACEPEGGVSQKGLCLSCCCTMEASNLYGICRREWDMYQHKMVFS